MAEREDISAMPGAVLESKAKDWNCSIDSLHFAQLMDKQDPLRHFRDLFIFPKKSVLQNLESENQIYEPNDEKMQEDDDECIYLCGQSLGLQPKAVESYIKKVLENWADRAVYSHFHGYMAAAYSDLPPVNTMAELVGAKPSEIAIMNGLTVNLHILLASFYRPTPDRYKIMIEDHAFPSDMYVVQSHLSLHGYSKTSGIIKFTPRRGEHLLREEDLIADIHKYGDSVAVILIPSVQYYSGQLLNSKPIIKAGHDKGCIVGVDLAHAIGNVEIKLDEWEADFAAWCTYKYLNSGAGGISAIYVNEKHTSNSDFNGLPILRGWWGNNQETRFEMKEEFEASKGAAMFRISNPPPVLCAMLMASLDIYKQAQMERLLRKQFLLTGYLEYLLRKHFVTNEGNDQELEIITPNDPKRRGNQLSLSFMFELKDVQRELLKRGVVCDLRMPSVMRVAPAPLYNSFSDIYRFGAILKEVLGMLDRSRNNEQ